MTRTEVLAPAPPAAYSRTGPARRLVWGVTGLTCTGAAVVTWASGFTPTRDGLVLGLGWVLALVGMTAPVPQAFRTWRTGDVRGLSLTMQVCWVISWVLWLGYFLAIGAWPKVATALVGLIVTLILLAMLVRGLRRDGQLGRKLVGSLPLAVAGLTGCVTAWFLLGEEALAGSLTVFDSVSLIPTLLLGWRSPSLGGLSIPSWMLYLVVGVGWVVYAFSIGHPLAAGSAYPMVPAAVVMIARIRYTRQH